ncbi:MAG: SET domain-containing protein-lysine N-methyltransferase [Bacteroidia bacterium]|nr:SET domain-containing protein-lysine N-methyltransferase [Bacteroidia bacterium]
MGLKVKISTIPGSGKGLFTDSDIKKGDIICEYEGEKMTWKECQKRNEDQEGIGAYYFHISDSNCVDAQFTLDAMGRYANDAKGMSKIKGLNNNAEYQVIKKKPYIVAKKNIKAGSEILVAYGAAYWKVMKEALKGI